MFRRSMRNQKEKAKARRKSAEAERRPVLPPTPPQTKKPRPEPAPDAGGAVAEPAAVIAAVQKDLQTAWHMWHPA
jgi:hypothetical protein